MRYIKTYETIKNKIEIKDHYCWIINGDIINVLNKLHVSIYKKYRDQLDIFISSIQTSMNTTYKGLEKIYIFYDKRSTSSFTYWPIQSPEDEMSADYFINDDENGRYDLQGELKIVNDKVILDTLLVDINKYNI